MFRPLYYTCFLKVIFYDYRLFVTYISSEQIFDRKSKHCLNN